MGLAWTAMGGSALYIETSVHREAGRRAGEAGGVPGAGAAAAGGGGGGGTCCISYG